MSNHDRSILEEGGYNEYIYLDEILPALSNADSLHDPLTYIVAFIGIGGSLRAIAKLLIESTLKKAEIQIFSRYVSFAELNAIKETGLLRGGKTDSTYFTTDVYESAIKAQDLLALPNIPDARVDFIIQNTPKIIGPTIVRSVPPLNGGGLEYYSNDVINVTVVVNIPKLVPI